MLENRNGFPMNRRDVTFYLISVLFCFFSFNHSDILHTGGCSITYLNGHILDFYDINQKALGTANYLASTYIIFAVWNLPIRMLNLVIEPTFNVGNIIFWYKLLPTIFLAGAAYYFYKIGILIKLNRNDSILMTAFWLSSPILLFSQFIFGQYDIFTVFFTLIGLYFYLQRKMNGFIFFFAIALTFKYFPIFIFIPLLLLVEKRLWKIILIGIVVLIPIVLELLPYLHSAAFREGIFGFQAAQGIARHAGIVFDILWLVICGFAFWKKIENGEEFLQWTLYLPMAVTSLMFSFIAWNPQWLLFATPFLASTTFINKRARFFVLLDILMMFFFVAHTVNSWPGWVDQALWGLGIFKGVNPSITDPHLGFMMKNIYVAFSNKLYYQLLSLCFIVNVILKMPVKQFTAWGNDFTALPIREHRNLVRLRFAVGIAIFIIPAAICLLIPMG